jgi:hypothetical protein
VIVFIFGEFALLKISVDHEESVKPSISLDSFLPLLRVLPALVLDEDTYVRSDTLM